MTNIYWSIYKNIESEVEKLMFSIHINDSQLNVYSSKIATLILRAATEIESISKDLYQENDGKKTVRKEIQYDRDAIKLLEQKWLLSKKTIIISNYNYHGTNKELKPFEKNITRTGATYQTFWWNNAYQNLKHDRSQSLEFGSIKYLFEIMSALFILNIYYKNDVFDLEKDSKSTNFPINLGSKLFSIKLHIETSYNRKDVYKKATDFDECIYLSKWKDESKKRFNKTSEEMWEKNKEFLLNHPKYLEWIKNNKIEEYKGNSLEQDVLGKDIYLQMWNQRNKIVSNFSRTIEYEAILNKQQF